MFGIDPNPGRLDKSLTTWKVPDSIGWKSGLLYFLVSLVAVCLPPLMVLLPPNPIIGHCYATNYEVFGFFGFTASVALVFVVLRELKRRRAAGPAGVLPVLLFLGVCSFFVLQVAEYTRISFDYSCYEKAAKAIEAGGNPYLDTGYYYPPFVGNLLALGHGAVVFLASRVRLELNETLTWGVVFYGWRVSLFFLALAGYLLSLRLVHKLGAGGVCMSILVAALFVFNNPLARTLIWNQANLWMLDAVLFVVAYGAECPLLAGLFLALAVDIKIYPAVLLLPVLLRKRWRMLGAFVVSLPLITFLETDFGRRLSVWRQFFESMHTFPMGRTLRDNGLHSVVSNVVWMAHRPLHLSEATTAAVVTVLWIAVVVLASGYVLRRMVQRERSAGRPGTLSGVAGSMGLPETLLFAGHVTDLLFLILMAAPLVWEHYYVLSLPVMLYALVMHQRGKTWLVGAGMALILVPTTFEVFPLSYHRLAGLLMMVLATPAEIDLGRHRRNVEDLQVLRFVAPREEAAGESAGPEAPAPGENS